MAAEASLLKCIAKSFLIDSVQQGLVRIWAHGADPRIIPLREPCTVPRLDCGSLTFTTGSARPTGDHHEAAEHLLLKRFEVFEQWPIAVPLMAVSASARITPGRVDAEQPDVVRASPALVGLGLAPAVQSDEVAQVTQDAA